MDTYYLSESDVKYMSGVYTGCDPNLKHQKCLIIEKENIDNKFKVRFSNEYMGSFEVYINKSDIFLV